MILPQIVIDVSGITGLLDKPLPVIWWTVFVYGGWIPFVVILWSGFSKLWIISRQNKYAATLKYMLLSVSIPSTNEQSPKAVEHVFIHLAGVHSSPNWKEKWLIGKFTPGFSFEYASIDGYTQFIVRTPVQYCDLIEASVFSQNPGAEIVEIADYTQGTVPLKHPDPEWDCWGTEFVLTKPSAYPLRTYTEFEHSLSGELKDPLASLLETLSRLKRGEQVWLQFLVYPRDNSWVEESLKVVGKIRGTPPKVHKKSGIVAGVEGVVDFGVDILKHASTQLIGAGGEGEAPKKPEKELFKVMNLSPGEKKSLENMELKMSKIGFNVKIRFVYAAKRGIFRKGPMISMVKGALGLFGSLDGNSFKPYGKVSPKSDYFWQRWSTEEKKTNIIKNFSNRSSKGATPFVLNVEELASLWHFPQILVKAPLLKKVESRKVEPPFTLPEMRDAPPGEPEE